MASGQSSGRLFRDAGFHDFDLTPHPSWWQARQSKIEKIVLLIAEIMPLHMKKNLLLGHGWHLTGNSLKWLTISYPVIWCDSPLNSTLNRCTFPIDIQNHSTISFHQHGSSEGQVITIRHAVKGSIPGNHKDLWPRLLIPLSLCPLYLHEPISPPRQSSACSPSILELLSLEVSQGNSPRSCHTGCFFLGPSPSFGCVISHPKCEISHPKEVPDVFLRPFSSSLWGSKQELATETDKLKLISLLRSPSKCPLGGTTLGTEKTTCISRKKKHTTI